jgi:4,5-dihydroxyphthalate decarboxylase
VADIKLTLACMETDRSRPILDGRVPVPGFEIVPAYAEPHEIFRRALQEQAYDLSELSMGSHITTTARGDNKYIAIPVFLSRSFRHSCIYVRSDRGIATPADLKGRRIGINDYQQTAVLWLRGMLQDEYGVAASDMQWRTGGMEAPAPVRLAIDLPAHLDVKRIGPADTLNALLVSGEIDAIMSPMPPSCYVKKTAPVERLFPDYQAAEVAYFKRTGFFPIMHCLTIRNDIAAANPDLPLALFHAFAKAKAIAMAELNQSGVLKSSLPWLVCHYAETKRIMGPNPWPYGFKENVEEVRAMCRYAATDGLAARMVDPAELFHPSTLDAADVA